MSLALPTPLRWISRPYRPWFAFVVLTCFVMALARVGVAGQMPCTAPDEGGKVLFRSIFGTPVQDPHARQEEVSASGWTPRRGQDGSVPVFYLNAGPGRPDDLDEVNPLTPSGRNVPERGFVNLFIAEGRPYGWLLTTEECRLQRADWAQDLELSWYQLTWPEPLPVHVLLRTETGWWISSATRQGTRTGGLADFPQRAERLRVVLSDSAWQPFTFPSSAAPAAAGPAEPIEPEHILGVGLYLPWTQSARWMVDTFQVETPTSVFVVVGGAGGTSAE